MNPRESAQIPPAPPELDFWSFVDYASARLHTESIGSDVAATRTLLTLNRASDLITYDLESSIHRPRSLSWSAFRLMYVLWLAGPMPSVRAARLTNMSRAAVSSLVTTLLQRNLLAQTPDPSDRRASLLTLTAEGDAEVRGSYRLQNAREQEWVSALTPDERGELVRLLEKLLSQREQIAGRFRA